MKPPLTESELATLGLGNVAFGDESFVPVAPAAEYGRASLAGAITLAHLAASAHFPTLKVDVAGRVGLRISVCDERPGVVRVVSEAGSSLETRSAAGGGTDWLIRDVGTVIVDLDQAGLISLANRDGTGVVIRASSGGFSVVDFYPAVPALPPLAEVRAPIVSWCATCEDAWLRAELQDRGALADSWQHAVAAGLAARLVAPPPDATALVDRLLGSSVATQRSGRAQPTGPVRIAEEPAAFGVEAASASGPRAWARALNQEQADALSDLALAVADRVGATVDDLYAEMSPAEEWWKSSFHAACLERDDLECVRVLLAERASGDRVSRALDGLDPRGHLLISGIPRVVTLADERLNRARLADPSAWWAILAAPEQR